MSESNGTNGSGELHDLFRMFVYVLRCPKTKAIRYVGVTKNPKNRLEGHLRERRRKNPKVRWVQKLLRAGLEPIMEIVEETLTWEEAEIRWIANLRSGGCDLLNVSPGGRNVPREKNYKPDGKRRYKNVHRALLRLGQNLHWIQFGKYSSKTPETIARIREKTRIAKLSIRRVVAISHESAKDLDKRLGRYFRQKKCLS